MAGFVQNSLSAVTQVTGAITGVDVLTNMASVMLRDGSEMQVHTDVMVGALSVTPAKGEQWIIEKGVGGWKLLSRLPYNDPGATMVDTTEGQTRVGSGRGPVDMVGPVNIHGPLKLQTQSTSARPAAADVGAGASIWDSTLGKPIWSNGTAWVDALGNPV